MGNKKDGSKKKKKEKLISESLSQNNALESAELARAKESAKRRNEVPDFEKLYAESSHGDDYTITFDF